MPWGSHEGAPIPKTWFHDIFWPNATCFSENECAFIRNITSQEETVAVYWLRIVCIFFVKKNNSKQNMQKIHININEIWKIRKFRNASLTFNWYLHYSITEVSKVVRNYY